MDLEKSILDYATNPDDLRFLWEQGVRGDHFVTPVHRSVYDFAVDYWQREDRKKAPTADVLRHQFPAYFPEKGEESVYWLATEIKKRYVFNQIQSLVLDVAKGSSEDPHQALQALYGQAWEIMQSSTTRLEKSNFAESVQSRRERYSERATDTRSVPGAPYGFDEVDEVTSGILPGELALIAGYAKTGKSWFLLNAAKAARDKGLVPYIATLELPVEDVEDRLDALISGLPYQKIQRGTLDFEDVQKLHEHQNASAEAGPIYIERPPIGERTPQAIVSRARELGADIVIIDQLSFMESTRRFSESRERISDIANTLKLEISGDKRKRIACLMAVQFNRASQESKDKRGGMHNMALSSTLEQVCDISFGLTRTEAEKANDTASLDIMGSRRTESRSWMLEWKLDTATRLGTREQNEMFLGNGVVRRD